MNGHQPEIRSLWIECGRVWLALIVFAAVSLASAYIPLGGANLAVNLVIAFAMGGLSVFFLMGLRGDSALIHLVALGSLFWLLIMFCLTFTDYFTRPI